MRCILSIILIAISANSLAQESASAASLLQAKLEALDTFSADFKQETKEQDGYVLDTQIGDMYFARPNLLRWEAKEPFAQTLVADGQDIYLYDPDLNQVTLRSWIADPAQNPAAIFATDGDIAEHFIIRSESDTFYLTPLSESSSLIELRLSFKGDMPVSMSMDDNLGQTTQITFSDQEIGDLLEPTLFRFAIPEGAEVVTDG